MIVVRSEKLLSCLDAILHSRSAHISLRSLHRACAITPTLVLIQHTSNDCHQGVCMRSVRGLLRRIHARFKRSNSSLWRKVLCVSEETQIAQQNTRMARKSRFREAGRTWTTTTLCCSCSWRRCSCCNFFPASSCPMVTLRRKRMRFE